MAEETENPKWSLVFWGGIALALVGIGVYCIYDGWFHPGFEHAQFNRFIAPACLIAAAWFLWRGAKEYRMLKSGAAGQGGRAPEAVAPGGRPPTGDDRNRPAGETDDAEKSD